MGGLKLTDLLPEKECKKIFKMFKNNDNDGVKSFLNEPDRKKSLEDKGILSDYLYYVLVYQFNNLM